jgi:hypothetical protein
MYLLDTPVLSEAQRRQPAAGVLRFLESQPEPMLLTSILVIGELRQGSARHPDETRRRELTEWLEGRLLPAFGGRILPVTEAVALRWGLLCGEAWRLGSPLPVVDALIAATALEAGLTVVTRNRADFLRCGAPAICPWDD